MPDWRFRLIRCPRCKGHKREPVNLHQRPPVQFTSMNGEHNHIYAQQCHSCTTRGAHPSLQAAYDKTWERLTALCAQKEQGGEP